MHRIGHGLVAVAVILASIGESACQTVDSGGGPVGIKECWIDTKGITVTGRGNIVEDYVTARCGPATLPQKHMLEAWLEIRRDDGYHRVGEVGHQFRRPDTNGVGLRIHADCQPGRFRSAWRAYGVGSSGVPFDYADHDFFSTGITETDCWG